LRFDHQWQSAGTPYAGRHRKGWLSPRNGRTHGYLQRVRVSRGPAGAQDTRPAHRGLPAVYDQQRAAGR
jgi:hypothetical protein